MGNKHGKGKSAKPSRSSRRSRSPELPHTEETVPSRKCRVWYRHNGEPEINKIPNLYSVSTYMKTTHIVTDYRTILRNVGDHHITHMHMKPLGDVVLPLNVIAPHLTHLSLWGIYNSHSLECLKALQHLQLLHVEESNFSSGLPHVISELTSLIELWLDDCQLLDLPQSLSNLKSLEKLDVGYNKFRGRLPPVVYQLDNLHELYVWGNEDLAGIGSDLLKLSKLSVIACDECNSLQFPPYAVCKQGLTAITKYFKVEVALKAV